METSRSHVTAWIMSLVTVIRKWTAITFLTRGFLILSSLGLGGERGGREGKKDRYISVFPHLLPLYPWPGPWHTHRRPLRPTWPRKRRGKGQMTRPKGGTSKEGRRITIHTHTNTRWYFSFSSSTTHQSVLVLSLTTSLKACRMELRFVSRSMLMMERKRRGWRERGTVHAPPLTAGSWLSSPPHALHLV